MIKFQYVLLQVSRTVKLPDIVITENSAEQPLRNNDNGGTDDNDVNDDVFGDTSEAVQGHKSTNSATLINSIKNRFYSSSESLSPLDIPNEGSDILRAQWQSRLPCSVLMTMLCPKSSKSSSGDISPTASSVSIDFRPSSPNQDSDSGIYCPSRCITPMADDLPEEEDLPGISPTTAERPYLIDDSIIPGPRPRANALDRSRTPRPFHRIRTAT